MLILLRVIGLDHEMEVRILGVVRKTKERRKMRELVKKMRKRTTKMRRMMKMMEKVEERIDGEHIRGARQAGRRRRVFGVSVDVFATIRP